MVAFERMIPGRIYVVGDSGLQLNAKGRRRRPVTFESQLQAELKPHTVTIHRYAGEGAARVTEFLRDKSASVVIVVWFLNELFDNHERLIGENDVRTHNRVKTSAVELAKELKRFGVRLVVLGGSASLWNVDPDYDGYVERLRKIFSEIGVETVTGVDCYAGLVRERWHVINSDDSKWKMAEYYAGLIRRKISERNVVLRGVGGDESGSRPSAKRRAGPLQQMPGSKESEGGGGDDGNRTKQRPRAKQRAEPSRQMSGSTEARGGRGYDGITSRQRPRAKQRVGPSRQMPGSKEAGGGGGDDGITSGQRLT